MLSLSQLRSQAQCEQKDTAGYPAPSAQCLLGHRHQCKSGPGWPGTEDREPRAVFGEAYAVSLAYRGGQQASADSGRGRGQRSERAFPWVTMTAREKTRRSFTIGPFRHGPY